MSELLNRMQGAIHSAVSREQAGFSGGIPWRVVQSWIPMVNTLESGCAKFRRRLYEWSQAYPTDVFPEPPYGEHGKTVDACSAAMGRHVTQTLLQSFDELVALPIDGKVVVDRIEYEALAERIRRLERVWQTADRVADLYGSDEGSWLKLDAALAEAALAPKEEGAHQPLPIDGQLAEYDDLRESP